MIILEGMDNSGKSTLAKRFGLEVVHPGPAPRNKSEELFWLNKHLDAARLPIVQDRVTCISSQVYGKNPNTDLLKSYREKMLETPHCILIYCRPPAEMIINMAHHNSKAYDTPEHIQFINDNAISLINKYDELMTQLPHIKFDWTHPEPIDCDLITFTQFNLSEWHRWKMTLTPGKPSI